MSFVPFFLCELKKYVCLKTPTFIYLFILWETEIFSCWLIQKYKTLSNPVILYAWEN